MWVLASAMGRNICDAAFDDLQEGLLNAFAGDVARDGAIWTLARNLVDFVDVDDSLLGPGDIGVCGMNEMQENIFHVFPNVSGLGYRRGVCNGKGYVEDVGEGLREEGLAGACRPHQENVCLLKFDIRRRQEVGSDALVMVVHRHTQNLLWSFLANDVLVELSVYPLWGNALGKNVRIARLLGRRWGILDDDLPAQGDALIADGHSVRPCE